METEKTEQEQKPRERNRTWQKNHVTITLAVDKLVRDNERMPTQQEIADVTGLSRQAVNEHLNQFREERLITEELDLFEFMASKVLGKVMERAMDGDMKASRLSAQIMGILIKARGKG